MAADDYERHDAWLDDYEEAGAVIRECVSDIEKLTGESVRRKKTKRKHFFCEQRLDSSPFVEGVRLAFE